MAAEERYCSFYNTHKPYKGALSLVCRRMEKLLRARVVLQVYFKQDSNDLPQSPKVTAILNSLCFFLPLPKYF